MLSRISHVEDDYHFRVKALDVLCSEVKRCLKGQPVDSLSQEMFLGKQLFKATVGIRPALSDQLPGLTRVLNLQSDRHAARRTPP